ncbi:hypothetical protein HPULCUR_012009 [Helicostylum pulchrum]|uniref:Uncharacterized protein n=1 Tax=Helicostylum pulchrum TaxID=562976 RepID=A0ABP9YHR7_9FUNG
MPLFSYKKNRIIPALPPAATLRHNLYSEYNRLVPSPPPPPFIANDRESFYSNTPTQTYKVVVFVFTFKKPEVTFNGNGRSLLASPLDDLKFEYSISNENFFEINFDSIKAVIYYPTPNKTTVGVAEIHNLILGPQTRTNVTFPVHMISSSEKDKSDSEKAFRDMVISSCDGDTESDIVVSFDLMPTIRIYNYPIVTLAFIGQKTKMSCGKLQFLTENPEIK